MRTKVSRPFRQFVFDKYPALSSSEAFLRFFRSLCFSTFFDEESSQLVIPTKTIAEQFYEEEYTPRFNGKEKLEEFRDKVLPGLQWSNAQAYSPDSWTGKARTITCNGFDSDMQAALDVELRHPGKDQVDLITGKAYRRTDRYQESAKASATYEAELQAFNLNPTQLKIATYMKELNAGHMFLRKLNENQTEVDRAIALLPSHVQEMQYRILASARQNPNIYYVPSSKERTCRLSPRGDTLIGLKSEARKAATKGWTECDLRSSQFAILAAKLNAPLSKAFIASGNSIWQEFYLHTHGIDKPPPKAVKDVFKEAMYSICFGRGIKSLKRLLKEHAVSSLLSHPILEELLAYRKQWFEEIDKAGGGADVWGTWQATDNAIDPNTGKSKRWAGAVAASVIQSIEMAIIEPIFDVAIKHGESDQFSICLFQHDGATISFRSKEKKARAQRKLKAAVEERAEALGIATILEFTDL